ncbi:OPA3-like protein isoform X2 [Jatropha curcas]|uniref:OPA3-like protein isoform X2 n=1 Tax=Jatropha curcas TaxID=180498 RepID=UPI0005FB0DB5|nr:OPA3-like protein isoform X2 [Jatropha curcas]
MVLPLLKLGTLAVKTLSKPLASKLKQQAAYHPKFRQFIVNFAQANHRLTTTMQRRLYSHATDVEIRPLNEEKAVQAAVDLIGELFVFTVAGAVVIFEVQRSAKSEARKEETRRRELEGLLLVFLLTPKMRHQDSGACIILLLHISIYEMVLGLGAVISSK